MNKEEYEERERQWEAFHRWEREHPAGEGMSLEERLRWYEAAMAFARRYGPPLPPPSVDDEKYQRLRYIRSCLSKARLPQ